MRTRGGYLNYPNRLPVIGDTVILDDGRYIITAIDGDRVIVRGESHNPDDLTLDDANISDSFGSIVPNSPTNSAFGNESSIGSPGSFSFSEHDSINDAASPSMSDMTSRDEQSASEYSGSNELQFNVSDDSDQTTKATVTSSRGGKRRKSKRKTKRKLKWDNKATIAVVATTMAFDKPMPPTDLSDPTGGKKTKRKKSSTRKKPRSLKKRVR